MTDPRIRLTPETTALLVVDPQQKLVPAVVEPERLVRSSRMLLHAARELSLPVVATTQYEKGLGPLVEEIAELLPEAAVRLEKLQFSCFDDDRFGPLLEASGLASKTLLVTGIEAHICVAGTVLGALRAGFDVAVAVDAVSARSAADARVGLARLEAAGALMVTSEMAVYELLQSSGTPRFKAMLPFLKGKV